MKLLLVSTLVALAVASVLASDYDDRRAASVRKCNDIDAGASQTGLYFNPDGSRSYYVRSRCFQETAVNFRDDTLCGQVKQRRSLLSSSWGYSASRCRTLVADGVAADRRSLEDLKRQHLKGAITLRDFRIQPNGNGRDFDIIPTFDGERPGPYTLTIAIVPPQDGVAPIPLHSSGYYLDGRDNLRIFVRGEDIGRRLPGFAPGRRYTVRATLTLTVPAGTGDVRWPDAFIDQVFPARERSQSIAKEIDFPIQAVPRLGPNRVDRRLPLQLGISLPALVIDVSRVDLTLFPSAIICPRWLTSGRSRERPPRDSSC